MIKTVLAKPVFKIKMSIIMYIAFFSSIYSAKSQNQNDQIDAYAKSFSADKFENIEVFAQALAKSYTTDYDKARVIFAWIGTHIRYDFKKFETLVANGMKHETKGTSMADIERKINEAKEAETIKSFKSKKGICEDYSRMYKKMCEAVNVECQFIGGLAKHLSQRTKGMEHAWNAVKIEDKWQLLDATWGSGYVEDERFKPEYSPGFFMVEPRFFILNHLPNEDRWQFLEKPLNKETFKRQPWINYGQMTFPIEDIKPLDTAIKPEEGKATIKIKLAQKPALVMLASPAQKPIQHTASEKDGYLILTFNANNYPFVYLNVIKSKQDEQFTTIGKFYLEQN
jgi:Transglutaminase-like superfamily